MATFLYTLLIYPIKEIISFSFQLFQNLFKSPALSCIGVSLAVSLLCLPLYIVAEKWQEIEREKERAMKGMIRHIKKTFKGNEQYMLLSTYYREEHYSPLMSLRASFGLLIQIPFFIAAYSFLSSLPLLKGKSFLFIADLSLPDAITSFTFLSHSFNINLLPILMTVINIAGSAIYTKGFSLKEKVQLYLMALVFLVILYDSPAGLVLYWTCNNLFSLVKNLFYKIKNPKKVSYIIALIAIVFLIFYLFFIHNGPLIKRLLLCAILFIALLTPIFIKLIKYLLREEYHSLIRQVPTNATRGADKKTVTLLFMLGAFCLLVLTCLVIPSFLIRSSVVEFMNIDLHPNPLHFLFHTFLQGVSIFIVWGFCIYFLFSLKVQLVFSLFITAALYIALINSFIFYGSYPTLSNVLIFSSFLEKPAFPLIVANLIAMILAFFLPLLIVKLSPVFCKSAIYKKLGGSLRFLTYISSVLLISLSLVSVINIFRIQTEYKEEAAALAKKEGSVKELTPIFNFTKTGKNVLLLMLDRAESAYFLPILEAYPEVKDAFKGFIYYPNIASYNQGTLLATPPLFGGYEYTPLNVNKRDSVRLVDKHNEALTLLPRIFSEQADYVATASDLSWCNYSWIADMSVFNKYKVTTYNSELMYKDLWIKEHPSSITPNLTSNLLESRLIYFSLFKALPVFMRDALYDDGRWWQIEDDNSGLSEALDSYAVLDYLPRLTSFTQDKNTFLSLTNDLTHSNVLLQPPNYLPAPVITPCEFSNKEQEKLSKYQYISVNVAALRLVAKWIKYLIENDCYNNTRIVIVSDHGIGSADGERLTFPSGTHIKEFPSYKGDHNHPLLLVKDFNATGDLTIDNSFMTTADIPFIVTNEVVKDAFNPYTNKKIKEVSAKEKVAEGVILTKNWRPGGNPLNTFRLVEGEIYDIKENLFDYANWTPNKQELKIK